MKSLSKKIRKLEARIEKDMKKLSKLKRKMANAPAKTDRGSRPKAEKPARVSKPKKKKRNISPEARAKLAALMKARWDAKRAANAGGSGTSTPPAEAGGS